MLTLLKTVLLHCLTGPDGETYDPARVYLFMAVMTFLALAIFRPGFEYQAFGIGFGTLLAGGGLGIKLKAGTEPGGPS